MIVSDQSDSFRNMKIEIVTKKKKNGAEHSVVRDVLTGRELDIPIHTFDKDVTSRCWRLLDQMEKAKVPGEKSGQEDLMSMVPDKVMTSNPIIALPSLWPKPHQHLVLNLPAAMYAGSNKDSMKVGDVMKTSQDANATMALAMFIGEIINKSVVGMEDARPPKKKKKNKDGTEAEPDEADLAQEMLIINDSYVRELGAKGVLRSTFKHDLPSDCQIDVPRVQPLLERLIGRSLETLGYRLHIMVLDPKFDFNASAEEMIKRIQIGQTQFKERNDKAVGKNTDTYCSATNSSCYRRVSSLSNLSDLLRLYFGYSHPVSNALQEAHTDLMGDSIPLSSPYCKAHLTTVLSLENALSHPMVREVCEVQRAVDRYRFAKYPGRFPLPFSMHAMSFDDVEPSHFYSMYFPVSLTHRLFKERIESDRKLGLITQYSEPDCDFKTYSRIVASASKTSKCDQDSILSAGMAAKDPTMRTLHDKLRSLDILNCKAPVYLALRQDAERNSEPGSPEYLKGMSEFKNTHIESCFNMFNRYMDMQDLFSPSYIAALTHIGNTSASGHWGDWFMAAKNLNPHSNLLLMLMHRMTRVHETKRGNNQRQLLIHYFSMLSSAHPHDNLKLNLLLIDSNSTSKSYMLTKMALMALEGTVENLSHITANAFNVTGSRNGITVTMEEMNAKMLGIGTNGKPETSEIASNFKNMLTNQKTTTISCFVDEFGNRKAMTYVQPVRGAMQGALNQQLVFSATGKSMDQSAELSRFMILQPNTIYKTGEEATLQDLVCGEPGSNNAVYAADFQHQMRTFHAYYIIVNMMIGCNVLHPVFHQLGSVVLANLNRRLEANHIEKLTPRMCEMLLELMKAICTWCAVVLCTASEHSLPFRFDPNGQTLRFRPEIIREIEKLLVVNSQHVMFAITLLNSNIVPLARQKVTSVLWENRKHFRTQPYQYKDSDGTNMDPRYDLLETGGMDALAAFIAEHSGGDISTQAVRAQLDSMRNMTKPGFGCTKVLMSNTSGNITSTRERKEQMTRERENYQAKLIATPNERTAGVGNNRFNYVLILKAAYDPTMIANEGRQPIDEKWLSSQVASILSHGYTEECTLLHAGVLRRSMNDTCIQSALGVVQLKKNPKEGLIYIRKTHNTSADDAMTYNTLSKYLIPSNQRQAFSAFGHDHDFTMMAVHHEIIGIVPELELLPENLRSEMLMSHDYNSGFFGAQDANAYTNYPEQFYDDYDKTVATYERVLKSSFSVEEIECMKSDPVLRAKVYYCDVLDRIMKAWELKVKHANKTAEARAAEQMIIMYHQRGTDANVVPPSSNTQLTKAETRAVMSMYVKKLPESVCFRSHVVNESGRRSSSLRNLELEHLSLVLKDRIVEGKAIENLTKKPEEASQRRPTPKKRKETETKKPKEERPKKVTIIDE